MKKQMIDETVIKNIIFDYDANLIGSPTLSKKYGIPKRKILEILKSNGCSVGKPGRRFIGGKSVADKKYYEKNKEKLKKWEKNNDVYKSYERLYQKKIKNKNLQYGLSQNNKIISYQYKIRKEKEHQEKKTLPFDINRISLKNSELRVIDRNTAEPIIKEYEWLGYLPKYCRYYFGLYFNIDGTYVLGGVVALQPEYGENMGVWDKYKYTGKIIQLSRGVCLWWTPKNSASYMISKVSKWLKENTHYKVLTATTDPNAGEIGTIYQSLNWYYVGVFGGNLTSTGKERIRYGYIIDGKIYNQRHIRKKIGTAKKDEVLKHFPNVEIINLGRKRRYFHFMGTKNENKILLNSIKDIIQSYPKR